MDGPSRPAPLVFGEDTQGHIGARDRGRAGLDLRVARAHPGRPRARSPSRSWAPSPPAPTAGVRASEPRSRPRGEQGRERGRRPLAPLGGRSVLVPGARRVLGTETIYVIDGTMAFLLPEPAASAPPAGGRRRHPPALCEPHRSRRPHRGRDPRCSAARSCRSSSRSRPAGSSTPAWAAARTSSRSSTSGPAPPGRAALRPTLAPTATRPSACS